MHDDQGKQLERLEFGLGKKNVISTNQIILPLIFRSSKFNGYTLRNFCDKIQWRIMFKIMRNWIIKGWIDRSWDAHTKDQKRAGVKRGILSKSSSLESFE